MSPRQGQSLVAMSAIEQPYSGVALFLLSVEQGMTNW